MSWQITIRDLKDEAAVSERIKSLRSYGYREGRQIVMPVRLWWKEEAPTKARKAKKR